MTTIEVHYTGNVPVQIEGFPENAERSREGSLHLHPGRVHRLTKDEYDFILQTRKDLVSRLQKRPQKKQRPKHANASGKILASASASAGATFK